MLQSNLRLRGEHLPSSSKFNTSTLTWAFHCCGFDTPFFAGRNAAFFREIWDLLAALGQVDDTARQAVAARSHLKDLGSFDTPSAASLAQLKELVDWAEGELLPGRGPRKSDESHGARRLARDSAGGNHPEAL